MGKVIDLTGQQFGRLTVIKRVENDKYDRTQWLCKCDCGHNIITKSYYLRSGDTQSCGCLKKELVSKRFYIHGHTINHDSSNTYETWSHMIQRCNNPNNKRYKDYGGRGIKVCEKWTKFEGFLQDMGKRPEVMTLDRVDNDGDYCKENCKWSTRKEQQRNTRKNRLITINGITKCIAEWCDFFQKPYYKVQQRIKKYNWTPEEALELVPRRKKNG